MREVPGSIPGTAPCSVDRKGASDKTVEERKRERYRRRDRTCEESGTDVKSSSQFARVVKGVDLRSTGGNSAWVRTPQLTVLEQLECLQSLQCSEGMVAGPQKSKVLPEREDFQDMKT